MKHILKCANCSKYTMNEVCDCSKKTSPAKPAKFSVEDKFASYRRRAKIDYYRARGLL